MKQKNPALIEALGSRVTKLGVAGFEMELAAAKPYQPESDKAAGAYVFWHKANNTMVNDSHAMTFYSQLTIKRSPPKPQTKSKQPSIKPT